MDQEQLKEYPSLLEWVNKHEIDTGKRDGLTTEKHNRISTFKVKTLL